MKVYICKFFDKKKVEHKVARLVLKEKKQATNLKVFCVDERIQQRLELAGIKSEVVYDFYKTGGVDDEPSWEKAYQLSDLLHPSAENDDRLKYSGINFLTLEYNLTPHILLIKVSNLCRRMAEQNCEILILVLTKPWNTWIRDINSPKVKTLKYGNFIQSLLMTRLSRYARYAIFQGYALLKSPPFLRAKLSKRLVGKHKALFVITTPLYAKPALAISNECLGNGLVPYVATDTINLTPLLKHQRIVYSIKPIPSIFYFGKMRPFVHKLRKHINSFYEHSNHLDAKSDEFSVAYLCKQLLLDDLPALCYLAISHIIFLERLIKETSPDIICLMPEGAFLQQIASALAKKYNIPTLAGSAALETGNARSHMRHLHADKKAAMGEVIKNIYIESGIEPERIVVTGIAHFDLLFNRDREQDNQALLRCNIDPSKRIILFTTDNISFSETERMLSGVINAVLKMKDTQLVVKVHPSEGIGMYRTMAEEYHDPGIHVVKDIDLYALISNCQLLITKYSTTALEAMMIDKPVVIINLSGQPTPVPYAEEGAAIGVYHYEDIEQAILRALYDEETRTRLKAGRDKFVRNWAGEPDGKASQRIVMLMKDMIASRK